MVNILFMICGRAGSKGFKNKNLKELNGIPLAYYTLAVIVLYRDAHPEDKITVAVNTDSQPLIDIFNKQKAIKIQYVDRKEELAGDLVPKVAVIQDTYRSLKENQHYDVIIDLDLTSPMRTLQDIENVIEVYNTKKYDLVYSVVESRRSPYFNMVEEKEDGYYRKICQSNYTARQQAPRTYELNASIYAYSPKMLEEEIIKTILEYCCGISVMKDYLVLDIDSEEDFEMMKLLSIYYEKSETALEKVFQCAEELKC